GADLEIPEIAVDDRGQYRRPLGERDIGNGVRWRRALRHAPGIDRAHSGRLPPLDLAAEAERTTRPRIPMRLAAGPANRNDQPAGAGRFGEGRVLGGGGGIETGAHVRPRITVALPCRLPSSPPVPCASARSQLFTCTFGCASPRSCRTASITLV